MSELEINNVKNLLSNVSLINKKYEDLAEYTGENFNVFNILGVYSSELSHSNFIANLLNAKGKHGQKDIFLKLFLEEISGYFNDDESVQRLTLDFFETDLSSAETEKHIGKVNYENGEGGFIDILINDGKSNIIIENKIWAGDQPKQLLRYNKQDVSAPIIYLTLNGNLPSFDSKGHLILYKDFICVSYTENIRNWLEQCIKEMANKPIVRETLNQYLNLVKQLTNQNTNSKMENDIIELMLQNNQNILTSKLIYESYNKGINKLKNNQIQVLISILKEYNFDEEEINIKRSQRNDGVFITLKTFELSDGFFDLGINIELDNNWFFFCVIRKNDIRKPNVNTNEKFIPVKEYLHKRILNLNQVNGWTIGKADDFRVGVLKEEYYLTNSDNYTVFENLAKRILNFKLLLEE